MWYTVIPTGMLPKKYWNNTLTEVAQPWLGGQKEFWLDFKFKSIDSIGVKIIVQIRPCQPLDKNETSSLAALKGINVRKSDNLLLISNHRFLLYFFPENWEETYDRLLLCESYFVSSIIFKNTLKKSDSFLHTEALWTSDSERT